MRHSRTLSSSIRISRTLLCRAVPAAAACAALTFAGAASARAAGGDPARPGTHLRPGAVTRPVQDLQRITRLLHRQPAAGQEANSTSTNWSGYAATTGPYTTVSSSWVEPSVSCTTNGIIAFWIGLDGYGSSTVEQDGTGVDCSTGTPQHFAWWETYPANSIQEYGDPVAVGDHLSSTVTSLGGGRYQLILADSTQRWTENRTVSASGQNASAEIITEAVSDNQTVTPLPGFGSVTFTGSTIDNESLQATGAQGINMTNSAGQVIATTGPDDSSGDFTVYDGATMPTANKVTVTSPGNQSTTVYTKVSLQIRATDSGGASLTFSATGLPPGLSISKAGLITGTTNSNADYNVTVTATDSTGAGGSASFSWAVVGATPPTCNGIAAWSATKFYVPGSKVTYNSEEYTATWFSRGATPGAPSSQHLWSFTAVC